MKHLQRVFRVLGNPRRLAIVHILLARKELSVGTIAHVMRLSLTATSRHLNTLANIDLLEKRQESTVVYYRINWEASHEVRSIIQLISRKK